MCAVKDGYVTGTIVPHQRRCEKCLVTTKCIQVLVLNMPEGVTAAATIMWNKQQDKVNEFIGIGCGCYAKLHRQIAHIADHRMRTGHAV